MVKKDTLCRMKRVALIVLILGLVFVVNRLVIGQRFGRGGRERRNRIPETSATLQSVKSLTCRFTAAAAGSWESGESHVRLKDAGTPVSLAIRDIDVQDGTAEIGGGSFRAGDNVIVKLVGANLHFLDMALNGGLGVVTVFAKETHDGRLQAVYSRAAYVESGPGGSGEPETGQYYGDCEAER
jgi:hypothetical protein